MPENADFGRITKFYHLPISDVESKRFEEVRKICHSLNGMYCSSMRRNNRYIPCGFIFTNEDEVKEAFEKLIDAGIL